MGILINPIKVKIFIFEGNVNTLNQDFGDQSSVIINQWLIDNGITETNLISTQIEIHGVLKYKILWQTVTLFYK